MRPRQRVIKVPDTGVFERTSSYLLARGITRRSRRDADRD